MSGKYKQKDSPQVYFSGLTHVPQPDQKVTDSENRMVGAAESKELALKNLKSDLKLDEVLDKDDWRTNLPRRPGYGSTGEPIKLWTNYFHMNITKGNFYRYDIKVTEMPSEKDGSKSIVGSESSTAATARGSTQSSSQNLGNQSNTAEMDGPSGTRLARIIELLLAHADFARFKNQVVSDFSATLLSVKKLPHNPMVTTVRYQMEGESHVSNNAKLYKVMVKEPELFDLSYLQKYLNSLSTHGALENRDWLIQALNIFLRHHARTSTDVTTLGRKVFPMDGGGGELDFLHCLSALRGFYSSVRLATSRILVNVNISHSTFYKVGPSSWRLTTFMSVFEDQVTKTDKAQNTIETVKNANYSLTNLEVFLQGLLVQYCVVEKEDQKKNPKNVLKVRRIHGLAHQDDGRHPGNLLKYPPKVPSFGAGPMEVEFYDSPEMMNKTQAEIDRATSQKRGEGGRGTVKAGGRTPTNEYIPIAKFIKAEYNIGKQALKFPVVNVGSEHRPVYLHPHFCWVIPGQAYRPKLSPDLMDQMHKFAVRKPGDNAESIKEKGFDLVGLSLAKNSSLEAFGVNVPKELLVVKGRILIHPKVKYGPGQPDADIKFAEWNMQGRKFHTLKQLPKWTCLSITMGGHGSLDTANLGKSLQGFTRELQNCGMGSIGPPKTDSVFIRDEKDSRLDAKMRVLAKDFELILVVLPKKHTLLYNKVKVLGDVRYGIHTVCVVGSYTKFYKNDPKYLANVALKFNLKLGGINHALEPAQLGIISEGKTMVVGYDVTHPAPGSNKEAPSIAAMVASIDKELAQWPADIYKNTAKHEMVDALGSMFQSRLEIWRNKHGSLPENILIYRDGVSEGQYKTVIDLEINKQLRPVCHKVYDASLQRQGLPRITFIVVGKRHHTRFYPTTMYDTENRVKQIDTRTSNPVGGTVVDRGITEVRNWDFFLQSHMAVQGTAKPTHYIVLLDEIFKNRPLPEGMGFKSNADVLETLTHNMCYLFGRATKAVSVCPPAYYADIACERARRYLDRFYNAPDQAYNRANDDRVLAQALDSEIRVDAKIRNSMFYI